MKKEQILIKHGRVVDPSHQIDDVLDILITDARVSKISKNIPIKNAAVIDAGQCVVMPGVVDMHVHLREPGREDKETIATGTAAALKGGVTSVLTMPNTNPCIDSVVTTQLLKKLITSSAKTQVYMAGAITKGRLGKIPVDMRALKKMGIVAFSDDGCSVEDSAIMQRALRAAAVNNLPVICHCEDAALAAQGVVNLGFMSTCLGLKGISRESEYVRVARDITLASKTKARIHIAHVSCAESVALIAKAKKQGIHVTAETAPHYFCLTDEALATYDTNLKMNPPLRNKGDVEAIKEGLKKGIIDAIASDHAPHTENEKEIEFDRAEFGVVGLETILSASITELFFTGILDWPGLVAKLSLNPARILSIKKGTLSVGSEADITIVDPRKEWIVQKSQLISKSKNSAFLGRKLKGVVMYTLSAGVIAYQKRQE